MSPINQTPVAPPSFEGLSLVFLPAYRDMSPAVRGLLLPCVVVEERYSLVEGKTRLDLLAVKKVDANGQETLYPPENMPVVSSA